MDRFLVLSTPLQKNNELQPTVEIFILSNTMVLKKLIMRRRLRILRLKL